jgi:hypothetical protein
MIFPVPQARDWAIFGKQILNWYQSAPQRDSLRLVS